MSCGVEFEAFNKALDKKETFYTLDDKKQDLLDKQITESNTKVQKELGDTLIREHSKLVGVNEDNYIDAEGTPFQRATQFLKKLRDGYYAYDEVEDEYKNTINAEWGNTVDTVFEGIILGKSIPEIYKDTQLLGNGINISQEAINKVAKQIFTIKRLHPGAVLLPQLTLSSSVGIAGTLDLLLIEPNGQMYIYDLKTSVNSITENWFKDDGYGNKYEQRYDKTFNKKDGTKKASKLQTHAIQLSLYQGMVEEITGGEVAGLSIIPGKITVGDTSDVTDIEFEALYPHEVDKPLLENMKSLESREDIINNLTDLTNTEFLQRVVEILENEVKVLAKQGKTQSIPKIQKIIENIQLGQGNTKISEFIEYMYEEFVSDEKSLRNRFKEYVKNLNTDENLDPIKVIQDLDLFKSEVELFRGVTEQLQTIYNEMDDSDVEKDSVLDKLSRIMSEFSTVENITSSKIQPIVANILAEQLPKGEIKEKLAETIKHLKKKLQKRNLSKRARKRIETQLKEVQNKYNESDKTILEALRTGNYKDISIISSNLNPAISVNNTIIATFAKTLKSNFEKIRGKLFNLEKVAARAFEEYSKSTNVSRDDVSKFNEDFYEIIDDGRDKPYYAFVQELDYNAFKIKMDELREEKKIEARKLKKQGKFPTYSEKSLVNKLVNEEAIKRKYLKAKSKDDTYIKNPYNSDEKVVIKVGYNTIIKETRKLKSPSQFNQWVTANFDVNGDGKLVPKGRRMFEPNIELFRNSKYDNISKNPAKKKYYDFLMYTYRSAQELIDDKALYQRIPGIEKVSNDRIREQGLGKWSKRYWEGLTAFLPNEEEDYGTQLKKRIPHYYSANIGVENTSLDLIASVLRYSAAAERYAAQSKMEPVANALLDSVSKNGPMHSADTAMNKIKVGDKYLGEYFRKHKGNNTAAMLEGLIDMHIYGKTRIKSELGNVNWNKVVDGLMGFASFTQIGGNPVLAVANSMAAHISTAIDAWAGEYISPKTWAWAKLEYRKNEGNFMKDMLGTVKKSKLGQLTEIYDSLQGEYFDNYGRKLSQSGVKKMWGSKLWFAGMHKGEHAAQTKVMMSILKDTMVNTTDGKKISLYDAYELDNNGVLKLKEGVDSEFINTEVQNKIHALNKRFNGVYNSFDKPLIERHNAGMLIMMYRKFIAPNIRRRFKGWGIDYEIGDEYEGYYRTFFQKLFSERDEVINMLKNNEHNLTPHEVANMKRAATEISYMALLSLVVSMLAAGLEGDDDDTPVGINLAMKYSLYWSMRAMSELSFYNFGLGSINTFGLPLNPGGTLRSFRTPSPIYSVFEKTSRALRSTGMLIGVNNEKAYYQRDMDYDTIFGNLAEKGDPKAPVAWLKLMGFNGYTFNIDNAIKILEIYD